MSVIAKLTPGSAENLLSGFASQMTKAAITTPTLLRASPTIWTMTPRLPKSRISTGNGKLLW